MTSRRRIGLLVFLVVAMASLVVLSMSLSQTDLQPGRPFYLGGVEATPTPSTAAPAGPDFWAVLRVIVPLMLWVGLPLLIVFIIWAILRKKKQYLIILLMLLGWAALILYLQLNVIQSPNPLWNNPLSGTQPEASETPTPTDVFNPSAPDWLVYAVSGGLAVLLLGTAWGVLQAWRRRPRPLELVAEEAQTALDEISAGADWKNAVVKCYAEMCRALQKARGLARKEAMTPREFARQLEEAGLPGEHIQRLTRLFETVRYGGKQVQPEDEHDATTCLTAVVQFCRGEP